MLVREIMTTGVKTARPDTPIRDIAAQMCLNRISGMPVTDENDLIVGIVSEKDILHHMFPDVQELMENGPQQFEMLERNYQSVIGLKASDLMTRAVATVAPDMPVLKAAALMWLKKVRRIPVAEEGRLVGIISIGDVHRAIFQTNLMGSQPSKAANG
ncbi:MAG: hypothetical protein Kow006_03490 [Gammaproteobacteria bacterium]